MIIDFHSHIFPPQKATKILVSLLKRAGIQFYSGGTLNDLLNSMHTARIDISVVSRITTKPEQVVSVNKWLNSIQQPNIYPLATMHPEIAVESDLIKTLKADGFKGFKLHPDYQGFFVDEKKMYPFYEAAQAEGLPILFHAGLDRGLPPPLHATPERLAKLLKAFPRLRIIAAHMGGEDIYEETEKYLIGKNIYLDTSFVLRKMPISIFRRFVNKHPVERLLFGTDFPWTDQSKELKFLYSLPFLSEEAKEKIAGTNASKVLKL